MNLSIVCVAGGSGSRFGGDKLAEPIAGSLVLELSLRALREAYPNAPTVLVVPSDRRNDWRDRIGNEFAEVELTAGGARRQDSVRMGVEVACGENTELVAVHDGARPLLHPDDFRAVVDAVGEAEGAVLCGRASDTVKRVDGDGVVVETIARDELRLIQTPQVFRRCALERAWREGDFTAEWTDEAALLESLGMTVRTCLARHANLKLTTPEDRVVIEALAKKRFS